MLSAKLLTGYDIVAYSAVLKAVDEFVRMRKKITRSVKVSLKCLIAVVLVDVDWTSTAEHLVAFAAIVSIICTAHAEKRLFMHLSLIHI